MKLTHSSDRGRVDAGKPSRARQVFAAAALAVACAGPAACSPETICENTREFNVTLKEGESVDTSAGRNNVKVEVLRIYQSAESENHITCDSRSGGATVRVTIETDPPLVETFAIVSNNVVTMEHSCTGASSGSRSLSCVIIKDTEVEQDLEFASTPDGGPAGAEDGGQVSSDGYCRITNERVSFTLILGSGERSLAGGGADAGTSEGGGSVDYPVCGDLR